jgi:PAS domain S-box-containing protein
MGNILLVIKDLKVFMVLKLIKYDDKNQVLGVLGIARNITELKKSQEELEFEKTKYKILMEYSSDAIFIVNLDGFIVECNKLFRDTLGYKEDEVLKLHVSDYEAIHSKEQIQENIKNVSFEPLYFELKYKKKDGTLFDVSISIIRVIIDNQEYIYSSFRDITEQKRLQNNILKQKEEFETIFESSHDSIAIIDLNTNFLKFNTSFMNMIEYTKEELLTKSCKDLTAPEDLERNESALKCAINRGHIDNFEKTCITKTGRRISVNMSASLLPDKKAILLSLKDISTLKILEEQSKLASMGEMIGNIAHQWRQPLSVITTSISGLKLKSDLLSVDKEDINECEKNILKQAQYLSQTIDNFRDFIKGDKDYEEISLKEILENAISLVHSSLHNNFINLIIDMKDDLKIFGNKSELSEAFINILNNSKDALKSNIKDELDRLIFISTKLLDENSIEVKILDSGKGIKEELFNKIFEPYFSTKHQSQGTGLGLLMADKIIRGRHGGKILVSNEEFEYNGKKTFWSFI